VSEKLLSVARDSKGQVMWINKRTTLSPLTYREWYEGKDMQSGTIKKSIYIFVAPFTIALEEEDDTFIIQWRKENQ